MNHTNSERERTIGGVPLGRIAAMMSREAERYTRARPKSREAMTHGVESYLAGVPNALDARLADAVRLRGRQGVGRDHHRH